MQSPVAEGRDAAIARTPVFTVQLLTSTGGGASGKMGDQSEHPGS
jgi:hypothetical protein